MDALEFEELVRVQLHYLENVIHSDTRFTIDLICGMHHDWLGAIYAWAGRFRSVNISKSGFMQPPAALVPDLMKSFEKGILAGSTPCTPAPIEIVAQRMARVHGELLLIHPFREGNGRIARWLADIMAIQAGLLPPVYGFTGRGPRKMQRRYLAAVVDAYCQRYNDLAGFFADGLALAGRGLEEGGEFGF